jgi:uncharacterized protein YceK
MNLKMKKIVLLVISFLFCNCSSLIFTTLEFKEKTSKYEVIYSGTKMNYEIISNSNPHPHSLFSGKGIKTLCVIDFLPSLVLDTILLPITSIKAIFFN